MAYGMLTSFALGAAEGLGNAVVNKVGRMQEEELKAKIEAEREQRIEEAAIRTEERKQAWEKNPENPSYQASMSKLDSAALEKKLAEQKLAAGEFEASHRADTYAGKEAEDAAKLKQIETQTQAAQAGITKSQLEQQNASLELQAKQRLIDAKTPQEREEAANTISQLTGKASQTYMPISKLIPSPDGKTLHELKGRVNVQTGEEIWAKDATTLTPDQVSDIAVNRAKAVSGTNIGSLEDAQAIIDNTADKKQLRASMPKWTQNFSTEDDITRARNWIQTYGDTMVNGGKVAEPTAPSGKGMLNSGKSPIDDLYKGDINVAGLRKAGSSEFEKSKGLVADLEADSNQLQRYATKSPITGKPITTLRETISTWSPKSENDTERLVNDAAKLLNIKPDDKIDLNDSATRGQILKALVKQEHGGQIKSDINKIYNYIDETYGSEPLKSNTAPDFSKFKFVGSR